MTRAPACELDWGLRRLHLPTIRRLYPPLITQAEKESWTYKELLEQLISEEIAHRAETRIARATRKAKFPYLKTLEEFDFTFQRSIERKTLGRYLGTELVEQGRCLVLLGRPGRGKTHLSIALAYKAIQAGYDARFTTAAQLLSDLDRAGRDGQIDQVLRDFVDPHVLVIDELGYLGYGPDAANAEDRKFKAPCRPASSASWTPDRPAWGPAPAPRGRSARRIGPPVLAPGRSPGRRGARATEPSRSRPRSSPAPRPSRRLTLSPTPAPAGPGPGGSSAARSADRGTSASRARRTLP